MTNELPSSSGESPKRNVPFFTPDLSEIEVSEVVATLRSGWLTTGPQVKNFEKEFAAAVNAEFAVALNSCTAALHLAVEALGLQAGQAVLVPTMTFAASAEIVLYRNALPILVDCDPATGNMDIADAERKIEAARSGSLACTNGKPHEVVGVIPVHVGGHMLDIQKVKALAEKHDLWIVEDAAHAFPAAWRPDADSEWQRCGDNTADVTCYSFYANKTITTGEGGMAVTNRADLADKIRMLSLHGLSNDAWQRYAGTGSWDYRIVLPGYKYNLTDIAAAIGRPQLARAEDMRLQREDVSKFYIDALSEIAEIELPQFPENRIHSWHLFPIRLNLDTLQIDRNEFMNVMKENGISCSVHWRPLHLHPLYQENFGWTESDLPAATELWSRLVSLPIFSAMTTEEAAYVVETVKKICSDNSAQKNYTTAK